MRLKNSKQVVQQASTISELWANLIEISSWALSLISGIALASQDRPVNLPGINIPLDAEYQFALLISALLAYIHFLQRFWKKLRAKGKTPISFIMFLLYELPWKHPLLLIPFVLLGTLAYKIGQSDSQLRPHIEGAGSLIGVAIAGALVYRRLVNGDDDNYDLKNKWFQRITKKLDEKGMVSTDDFYEEVALQPSDDDEQINWAINTYFDQFEVDQGLAMSKALPKTFVDKTGKEHRIESLTLHRQNTIK